ncbi:MAG TPA: threonine/serine exporter family protein [Balneolales bacterium]|nr:threonine/serine exporter family protein [Balneolales bacterium]
MNIVQILLEAFWSGIAALGFALLFNVPRRTLFACFLFGAMGNTVKFMILHFGINIGFATLSGAALVGFLGVGFSKKLYAPPPVLSIPGIIPMIPGTFAYKAMIGILKIATGKLQTDPDLIRFTVLNGTQTMIILIAISIGIAIPNLLFARKKPVV